MHARLIPAQHRRWCENAGRASWDGGGCGAQFDELPEHGVYVTASTPVEHVDHPLSVRVAFIRTVRRTVVYHCLVDWVRCVIGEDASREA
eukprot:scaffold58945_cov37-Tisochrysis_lutea.AAC.4